MTLRGKPITWQRRADCHIPKSERIWCKTMQNPATVLGIIESKASDATYLFDRLYRNFYNIEFYKKAHAKLSRKTKQIKAGTDGQTINDFNPDDIQKLIKAMKNESYQPMPVHRQAVKTSKVQQLEAAVTGDQLVQTILVSILGTLYEPNFSDHSHGYRTDRSYHTALLDVKKNSLGVTWWIKGDIEIFNENINRQILVGILKQRIRDEKFLRLIWKFLKAGYLSDDALSKTHPKQSQEQTLGHILANVYLNECDCFMKQTVTAFHASMSKGSGPNDNGRRTDDFDQKKGVHQSLSKKERQLLNTESNVLMTQKERLVAWDRLDPGYKRVNYVRYKERFLIGVIGSKEDAVRIKRSLLTFLSDQLNLGLDEAGPIVAHHKKPITFLDYDIIVSPSNESISKIDHTETSEPTNARRHSGEIKLSIPYQHLKAFMVNNGYVNIQNDGTWKEIHRSKLVNHEPLEIIRKSNAEFRDFYHYYKLAYNVREKLISIHWLFQKSVTKTLAAKYKTKVSKLRYMETEINGEKHKKFYQHGKWGIMYQNKQGEASFLPLLEQSEIQVVKHL